MCSEARAIELRRSLAACCLDGAQSAVRQFESAVRQFDAEPEDKQGRGGDCVGYGAAALGSARSTDWMSARTRAGSTYTFSSAHRSLVHRYEVPNRHRYQPRCLADVGAGSSTSTKEVTRARLDGRLGLVLDGLHDALLDRSPRRRRLRGRSPRAASAARTTPVTVGDRNRITVDSV